MAGYLNKVMLIGRLGRDPEVKTFNNGGQIANLRIATTESWKDRDSGERRERTEWHSVAISNTALVRIAEQYLRKGDLVYIEGKLETRKWQDQQGQDRYSTEIVIRPYGGEIKMLNGKQSDRDERSGGGSSNDNGSYGGGYDNGSSIPPSDPDDEIPF